MAKSAAAIVSRARLAGIRAADVRRDAVRMLRALDVEGELSVALVGDGEMHELNSRYRSVDRPTDVLAFALREGTGANLHPGVLGDVIISLDTAARQAAERRVAPSEEVRTLLAHGILHLLGYDHERSPAEARRMFAKQRWLIERVEEVDLR